MSRRAEKTNEQIVAKRLLTGFDRHSVRYFEGLFANLRSSDLEVRKAAFSTASKEQRFLFRRAVEPGLFRFVMKNLRINRTIQRYRSVLLAMILRSVMSGKFNVEDLVSHQEHYGRTQKKAAEVGYDRRQLQRLFYEYFPEMVFKRDKPGKTDDERVKDFSTIFGPNDLPVVSTSDAAREYYALDMARVRRDKDAVSRVIQHARLNWVSPEEIADLIEFRIQLEAELASLVTSSELSEKARSTILDPSVTIGLHRQLTSILALAWFRSRRAKTKEHILSRMYPLIYTQKDAHDSMSLLMRISELRSARISIAMEAAEAFLYFDNKRACLLMYEEGLRLPDISPLEMGVIEENVGVIHRECKQYKLMVRHMKKALDHYQDSGNLYRECVGLKNLSEAEYGLGFGESGLKYFREAEEKSLNLADPKERFYVHFNLAVASQRLKREDDELTQLKQCLTMLKEVQELDVPTNQVLYIDNRINQLAKGV